MPLSLGAKETTAEQAWAVHRVPRWLLDEPPHSWLSRWLNEARLDEGGVLVAVDRRGQPKPDLARSAMWVLFHRERSGLARLQVHSPLPARTSPVHRAGDAIPYRIGPRYEVTYRHPVPPGRLVRKPGRSAPVLAAQRARQRMPDRPGADTTINPYARALRHAVDSRDRSHRWKPPVVRRADVCPDDSLNPPNV